MIATAMFGWPQNLHRQLKQRLPTAPGYSPERRGLQSNLKVKVLNDIEKESKTRPKVY